VPFPEPKPDKDAAYKLAYARPSSINVVGSYALKTMTKWDGPPCVDMIIVMPSPIFQEKDFLNYRYFYKRAYYLACIAAGLRDGTQKEYDLCFERLHGNGLHPILILKSKINEVKETGGLKTLFEIRIIPAAPASFFIASKLRPDKNAVRPKDEQNTSVVPPPTPFYNASLQSDCNLEPFLKFLHATSKQSAGFKDGCILGRVWLQQRGLGSNVAAGGFGHFEWAALIALLLKSGGPKGRPVLSPSYSSYQVFKAVLQFLSGNNLVAKPLICGPSDIEIHKSGLPILYDSQHEQNLLYKMSPWSYSLLREEARTSLNMLNDETFDQFEATFIIKSSQALSRFDCSFRIPCSIELPNSKLCDHISDIRRTSSHIYEILQEGLSDRVKTINIEEPESGTWPIRETELASVKNSLLISVVFDPSNIDRLVDHGPSAEEKKKATKFQKFWGEKAELRRFKDGSILESLIWLPGSMYSVFQQIVTYLIKRHVDSKAADSLSFIGEGFDKLLPKHEISLKSFDSLKQAYNTFEKRLRDLEGLPLTLRHVSPISSQVRRASVSPPIFSSREPLKRPVDVLIQFEGSGRWPDDIVAIQRTKIAFLLKIGSLLEDNEDIFNTRLGLENEHLPLQNCAFLDVFFESGAVFRLRIHNDREQTLLERQIKDKSTDAPVRDSSVAALSIYKAMFIQLPLLTQSVSTHSTRFPLLSSTIRLVKLWFNRHMLVGHISDELIELLVMRTFLQPYPWRAPSSVMTGFLRTLLFISKWDWRQVPLVVDFTGTMTGKDVESVTTRLEAWRKIDPGMNRTVLIAASNHDTTGTAFTDRGPSRLVAARMTALARSACKLVKEKGLELDPRSLFAPATEDYNFLIRVNPKFLQQQKGNDRQPKFKNLEIQADIETESVGFLPVQEFLQELETTYRSSIVFFHDNMASSVIGGLWNPQTTNPRPFRVNLQYASNIIDSKAKDGDPEVAIDKSAILAEIARLGGDMVSKIEVT
jgi:U3 small nucleolar RNA-associated protein 22